MRRRLKNNGIITINGQSATWDTLVHGGDHLLMKLAPEQEFSRTPMNLEIVYEDDYILAINKAASVLMHPTSTMRDGTLATGVLYYYDDARCVLIEAMDGVKVMSLFGFVIIIENAICQCSIAYRRGRVHKDTSSFINGEDILIFVYDF